MGRFRYISGLSHQSVMKISSFASSEMNNFGSHLTPQKKFKFGLTQHISHMIHKRPAVDEPLSIRVLSDRVRSTESMRFQPYASNTVYGIFNSTFPHFGLFLTLALEHKIPKDEEFEVRSLNEDTSILPLHIGNQKASFHALRLARTRSDVEIGVV